MAFLDIVFFAVLAIFLGYRLWVLLGTHDAGHPIRKRQSQEDDLVIPIRPRPHSRAASSKQSKESETAVNNNDEPFLKGAAVAFQKIVQAYAKGDVSTLHKLLDGPLLETFEDSIEKRKQSKKTLELDIERIISMEILDQWEEKTHMYKTIRFVSLQHLVTRNEKGKILAGDPDRYTEVTDIWTFSRLLTSSNPNWKLVATQIPEE